MSLEIEVTVPAPPTIEVSVALGGAQGPAGPTGATGATGATGPAGPAGPAGADGGGSSTEVRHASDATYSYMGSAPDGTAEGSSGWTVTRISFASPPVVMTGSGTWTGRAGLTYS